MQSEIESRLAAYQRDGVALGAGGGANGASGAAYASMVAASNRQLQGDLASRSDELSTCRAQCASLEEELRALRWKSQQQPVGSLQGPGLDASAAVSTAVSAAIAAAAATATAEGRDVASVQQLRDRLSVHVKERRAIHTIMEQKIKTLVDAIAVAASAAPAPGFHPQQQLLREVQALQRLVNASITALRNSEHEQQEPSITSSTSGVPSVAATVPASTPLGRTAAPPQLPPYTGAAATTPASIDAMIQRRKDELARMRSTNSGPVLTDIGGQQTPAVASSLRPSSAPRGRPM